MLPAVHAVEPGRRGHQYVVDALSEPSRRALLERVDTLLADQEKSVLRDLLGGLSARELTAAVEDWSEAAIAAPAEEQWDRVPAYLGSPEGATVEQAPQVSLTWSADTSDLEGRTR